MRLCCSVITAIAVLAAPMPVWAQEPFDSRFGRAAAESLAQGHETRKLIISERAIAEGMAAFDSRSSGVAAQGNRDSLKNGTIIGAVIGAVGMGLGVGLLCKALQEPSDPSCWQSVGVGALYGAGIGAVGGLGIDALMTRSARALAPKPPAAAVTAVRP